MNQSAIPAKDRMEPMPATRATLEISRHSPKKVFLRPVLQRIKAKFINPDVHTFKQGLPVPNHPILLRMAKQMREAAQKVDPAVQGAYGTISEVEKRESERCRAEDNPSGLLFSQPLPLMRADWFIAQVSANMRMRINYHAAGMDDDTVTLDAALGIDDAEGSLYDNDPTFDRNSIPNQYKYIYGGE